MSANASEYEITEKRIAKMLSLIRGCIVTRAIPVDTVLFSECDYKQGTEMPFDLSGFTAFDTATERWGKTADSHAWFVLKGRLPELPGNAVVRLHADTSADGWNVYNPQFIAYIGGSAVQGLDANHRFIEFPLRGEYTVFLYAYTGSMGKSLDFRAYFEIIDPVAESLYYDLCVPYETALILERSSKEYADIIRCITEAIRVTDLRDTSSDACRESLAAADELFHRSFYDKLCGKESNASVLCIGHTHIDVAWLWTLAQTREKAQHTFSTVLALMDKYPSLVFFSSQPQLLDYIKSEDPELYGRIKKKVAEGRIELDGAMWVEADCNLTSGESLVRQIIHGKRFLRDEFGIESRILWLPDVFGYSASLPQICKKSGINTFVTSKISWNDTNRMPHDVFDWIGIDGTRIFTYFLTAQNKERGKDSANYTTYVATSDPKCIVGCWERFSDKSLTDEAVLTMGWGDGGGGPTAKMCEKLLRLERGVPGCPAVKQGKVGDFLERVNESAHRGGRIPEWQGELYLEYHRGTYTSAALNKRLNRRAEFACADAELYALTAEKLCGESAPYPSDTLYKCWQTVLLNQFHDIIPGSSIPEVYTESHSQYRQVLETTERVTETAFDSLLPGDGTLLAVFNPAFTRGGAFFDKAFGIYAYVPELPSAGYAVLDGGKAVTEPRGVVCGDCDDGHKYIENRFYRIILDENGEITSLKLRSNGSDKAPRELCGADSLNKLVVYEDIPFNYDCWNLEEYHTEKPYYPSSAESIVPIQLGCGVGYRITRRFMSSVITQDIIAFDQSERIDFRTEVDWKEKNLILKAEFNADINNSDGVFDIQYGFVSRPANRNTSWEAAKFEVCGQKYADISDGGTGLALINDSKYGYSVNRGRLTLSLLKASEYPNRFVDCAKHSFTYSLLPHNGDFRHAGVLREAALINDPPILRHTASGNAGKAFSLVSCDCPGITLGAAKKAYDGDAAVFRFCESFNSRTEACFTFGIPFSKAVLCSPTEEDISAIPAEGNRLTLVFKPFEIVTVKLYP